MSSRCHRLSATSMLPGNCKTTVPEPWFIFKVGVPSISSRWRDRETEESVRIGEVEIIRFGEKFGLSSCDRYQCELDDQLDKFMFSDDLGTKERGTVAAFKKETLIFGLHHTCQGNFPLHMHSHVHCFYQTFCMSCQSYTPQDSLDSKPTFHQTTHPWDGFI